MHTLHTGERINDLPIAQTLPAAIKFRNIARLVIDEHFSEIAERVTFTFDDPNLYGIDNEDVNASVQADPSLYARLQKMAIKRSGNFADYLAAHLVMHDGQASLTPMESVEPLPLQPDRIISLGAQSERPFYAARMLCKIAGVQPFNAVSSTAQLFTRHVLPPYQPCRQGEPMINGSVQLELIDIQHPVHSIRRDLAYIAPYLPGRVQ